MGSKKQHREQKIIRLRPSIVGLLIFGSVPALWLFLAIGIGVRFGFKTFWEMGSLAVVILFLVLVWNRGTILELTPDQLTYRKFFLFKKTVSRPDILRSVAVTELKLREGKPPFRIDIFCKTQSEPMLSLNLKPFSKIDIERLFEWLPNLDRSRFRYSLTQKKKF